MEYLSKLTAKELVRLLFEECNDEVAFRCDYCGDTISDWDLGTPCHLHEGFAEGSGHGGVDGMHVYCALDEPIKNEDGNLTSYCGWGGPVKEYVPLLLCKLCGKSPFKEEK